MSRGEVIIAVGVKYKAVVVKVIRATHDYGDDNDDNVDL